jgi:hypothetical protein
MIALLLLRAPCQAYGYFLTTPLVTSEVGYLVEVTDQSAM